MLRPMMSALAVAGVAAFVATGAVADEKAMEQGKEAGATETVLIKQALQGVDGKEVDVELTEVPPGFQTPKHIHPGDVFVYVLDGAVEIDLEGGDILRASAGEIIYEPPNRAMVGRNASSSEGARILVFYVIDEGHPTTLPVEKQ